MKTSAKWRAWLTIVGVLLGLLASMGLAAPANASTLAATSARSQSDSGSADLSLSMLGHGGYRVRGSGYEANRVHVWIVNVSRSRAVNEYYVGTQRGNFTIRGDGLQCGRSYKAVSYSRGDGWVSSSKVPFGCHS